jgi:hypothetical protein
MKKIAFPLLLILLLTQCEQKNGRILFDFKNENSIINYKIYHDSLVLIFPNKTNCPKWHFNIYLSATGNFGKNDLVDLNSNFPVVNSSKVVVPINISDTINIDSVKISLWGQPGDGMHFTKVLFDSPGRSKGIYQLEGNQGYFKVDSLPMTLQSADYTRNQKWYVIPDSLFEGKDSIFYKEKFLFFQRDSIAK